MSRPQDPRQPPLQDDEAALARVLHALPAGEPSARVDAAILAAARNAAATQRPARTSRRLPGWAIGTAAAAVLAVGIGLQLQPARVSGLPEGLPVEAPGEPVATPLPPPPPAEALPVPPPPPPPAFAEPPAASMPAPAPEAMDEAAAQARNIESAKARARAVMDQQLEKASAEREAAERAQSARLEEIEVTGSRLKAAPPEPVAEDAPVVETAPAPVAAAPPAPPAPARAPLARSMDAAGAAAPLPPVDEDARLAPEAWLERIRERLRQGDRAGARASLLRLQRAHPALDIPDDLATLRQ